MKRYQKLIDTQIELNQSALVQKLKIAHCDLNDKHPHMENPVPGYRRRSARNNSISKPVLVYSAKQKLNSFRKPAKPICVHHFLFIETEKSGVFDFPYKCVKCGEITSEDVLYSGSEDN